MKRSIYILSIFIGINFLFSNTQKIVEKTYLDFSDGESNGWILGQFGGLKTGISIHCQERLSSSIVFQMVTEPQGTLLIATGNDGKVYRIYPEDGDHKIALKPEIEEPKNTEEAPAQQELKVKEESPDSEKNEEQTEKKVKQKIELVFDADELMVYSIALDSQGNIFAGTSPNGKVFKITPDGKIELFFDPKETYIWDLKVTPNGELLVACGGRGALYRLSPDYLPHQHIDPIYRSSDRNVSSVVIRQNQNYLLGLNPSGQILEMDTEATVLRTAFVGAKEITQIVESPEQKIFITTFDKKNPLDQNAKNLNTGPTKVDFIKALQGKKNGADNSSANLFGSGLLEWQKDGYLRPIWRSPTIGVISFVYNGKNFVMGSADQSDLFSVSDGSPWEHWGTLEKGSFVSKILPVNGVEGQYWVATSSPAYLYKVGSNCSVEKLTYRSSIIDAGRWSQWGHLRIDGELRSKLMVKTRSGSFPDANKSWEDWQSLDIGKITSRSNQFLQYQLEIDPEEKSRIDAVTLFYRFPNQAPVFSNLKVVSLGMMIRKIPNSNKHYLDPKKFFGGAPVEELLSKNRKLMSRPILQDETGKLTVGWIAKDPEGDSLEYDLEIRNLSDRLWVSLVNNIQESIYSFDASGFTPGYYQIRVTASDRSDNAEGEEKQAVVLSESFLIDFNPPEITMQSNLVSDNSVNFVFD